MAKSIQLIGYLEEVRFSKQLSQLPLVKHFALDTRTLIKAAQSSEIGRRRLELARPHLVASYGVPSKLDERYYLQFDWHSLPASVILDLVFGIDRTFSFLGYHCGIDITLNPHKLSQKVAKLRWLRPLFKAVGIDKTAVVLIDSDGETNLKTALKQIIRGYKSIVLSA